MKGNRKTINRVLGALAFAVVLLLGKTMPVQAVFTPEVNTVLSDPAYFPGNWNEMSLVVNANDKSWELPMVHLMGTPVAVGTDEEGNRAAALLDHEVLENFLNRIDADLANPANTSVTAGNGHCWQLVDGFEAWYEQLILTNMMSGPVKSIYVTLNPNTCTPVPYTAAGTKGFASDLQKYVPIGTCTTSFKGSSADRIANITLAAGNLNGAVILPGATASADEAIGPRSADRGFRKAGAYVGGKLVPSLGGGICQVSSTLYDALMNAGVTVVERHNHSSPVHYLPLGMDSTISRGTLDLKFRNDYAHPIVIQTEVSGKNLTVTVLVRPEDLAGRSFRFWSKKTGSMSADSYLTIYQDGVETETRFVGTSKYKPLKE